eukprot:gene13131-13261_t
MVFKQILTLLVVVQVLQLAAAQNSATLTVQFDNSKRSVVKPDVNAKIIDALAKYVFLVPSRTQIQSVSGIDQSGILTSQAVITYRAVGPTTNGRSVLAKANIKSGFLGLTSSPLEKQIKRATDTWWAIPGGVGD